MEPSHPPYAAGALTIPRTLIRWLDVNPQNGSLTRTQTYITLPPFAVGNTWNGYSDIVASFNCESPNAFSFTGLLSEVPANPNYTLCVSYRIGGVVTRYILWLGAGSVLNMAIPMYSNQPIKKNFRFEIWNTKQGAVSQTEGISFYTTVSGGQDYRYGVDGALVVSDAENTSFAAEAEQSTPPLSGLLLQFDAAVGVSGRNWTAAVNNTASANYAQFVANANITTVVDATLSNRVVITNPTEFSGIGHTSSNFGTEILGYIVFKNNTFTNLRNILALLYNQDASTDSSLAQYTADGGFGEAIGQFQTSKYGVALGTNFNGTNINAGDWLIGVIQVDSITNNVAAAIYRVLDGVPVYIGFQSLNPSTFSKPTNAFFLCGIGNHADIQIAEFLVYNDPGVTGSVLAYLGIKYCAPFALPLTFPLTSISETN